jgi:hypothetical protein
LKRFEVASFIMEHNYGNSFTYSAAGEKSGTAVAGIAGQVPQ